MLSTTSSSRARIVDPDPAPLSICWTELDFDGVWVDRIGAGRPRRIRDGVTFVGTFGLDKFPVYRWTAFVGLPGIFVRRSFRDSSDRTDDRAPEPRRVHTVLQFVAQSASDLPVELRPETEGGSVHLFSRLIG